MGWFPLLAALVLFFVLHALPVRPGIKARIVAGVGARGFTALYSLVSLLTLALLIVAAGHAPVITLWPQAPWQRYLALALMALATAIFALAVGRPNPLSFGGADNARFDPAQSGLIGWVRHPLLAAIGLWALAHLVVNGDLAHLCLFGLFAGFARLGMRMIDRRKRRQLGPDWPRLNATDRRIKPTVNGLLRLLAGALLFAVLLAAHPPVIGVSPLP